MAAAQARARERSAAASRASSVLRLPAPRRYAHALGLAVVALGLTELFHEPLPGAHFVFSTGAVFLAGLAGGTGPALAAVALCAACYPLVAHEAPSAFLASPGTHAIRLGVFLLVGAAQGAGAGWLRRAYVDARRARIRSEGRAERQRRARLRAGEQLELLRAITGNLAEGLFAVDRAGRLVFMNAAAARMLGWSEGELAGRVFHDVVHARRSDGAPLPARECAFLSVLDRGVAVRAHEEVFVRKDGTSFPVSYSSSPIARGGKVVGAAVGFQDVTAQRRAAEGDRFLHDAARALTESIEWEATLARVAQLAVPFLGDWCFVVADGDGKPRITCAAADPALAAASRELVDSYPIDPAAEHGVGRILRTGEPELVAEVDPAAFAAGGTATAVRVRILESLGLRSYMGVPLVARGRTVGAIAFGIAHGDRRYRAADLALAEELATRCALAIDNARLYREAREATQSREEVLALVSHDLRAPLGAAQLASQLLARLVPAEAAPELHQTADTVRRATGRLARLIDDLVDFERGKRGAFGLSLAPHDPEAIAREAVATAEPLALDRGVALTVDAQAGAAPVRCDRHRVLQALDNLIANSIKVMGRGGAVSVAVRRAAGVVSFRVSDSGPGIAPEDLPRVFERYWRGQGPRYEGSGLGLAIARTVVEAHGGRIWAESEPGQGATFTFTLPVDRSAG